MDVSELQHDSITVDNRTDFNTHMEKFDSLEAAAVDGMGLKKLQGQPFKFPESMDKLPDDASRADFTAKANALIGHVPGVKSIEDLADTNFAAGMAEGGVADENITGMLKNIAVEKGWPASVVEDIVGLYNGPMTEYAIRTMTANKEAGKIAQKTATNEALIAHPSIGSEAKLNEQSELLRRTIQNKCGLNAAEFEEFGNAFADSALTSNPVMARALLHVLAPMSAGAKGLDGDGLDPKAPVVSAQDQQVVEDIWGKQ